MTAGTFAATLEGTWRFALDREDAGIADNWFNNPLPGDETVRLPGSMLDNDKGDAITMETPWTGRIRDMSFYEQERYAPYREPGKIKVPFFLTPLLHYMGVAWYQREIDICSDWDGNSFQLHLERPHWTTQVWIDGHEVGFEEALSTPHVHLLGYLNPGKHTLTIRVDNRLHVDVGEDAHSVTDQTQTNWNGITGELKLVVKEDVWFDNIQIYPAGDKKSVLVKAWVKGDDSGAKSGKCRFTALDTTGTEIGSATGDWTASADSVQSVQVIIPISSEVQSWNEFTPALYQMRSEILKGDVPVDVRTERFGFRKFEARGTKFYLNDRHLFLRGTHEGCTFPKTGYPPTDKASWIRIFRIIKDHGLNHMRFHSWCPPRAAFEAADEEGIILSAECASWTTVGFEENYDKWLYREADRILKEYGNHPSFCMMLYGNEPYGFRSSTFLAQWVEHYKAQDRRRLFSAGTAWPLIPENEFQVWANARIQYWDENLDSRINARPPETTTNYYADYVTKYEQPIISHEIGQWCAFPNFEELPKYDGKLRPGNFEIFQDFLEASGMVDQANDFLMASGMLQVTCYKEEVESALRTPGFGGFHLLDLHDYTGQGTAIIGVLDVFWDPKPYITAEEYKRFAGPVVALAQLPKRIYTAGETFEADLLVSQFGEHDLPAGDIQWTLTPDSEDEDSAYAGVIAVDVMPSGALHDAGKIKQQLSSETKARKLNLEVELPGEGIRNDWDIWVYPETTDIQVPNDLHIASRLDDTTCKKLQAGGKVFLMPDVEQVLGDERGQVPPGFSTIFYNTAWTQGQKPHTMGILCDPAHAALASFPTEYHSNWQWWYIIQKSRTMILNPLPMEIQPIVQVIDDWFTVRRLGLLFECEMCGGKLLVSGMDFKDGAPDNPVCRQMYYSLLEYAGSSHFNPQTTVTPEQLKQVLDV